MTTQAPSPPADSKEVAARERILADYEQKTSWILSTLAFVFLITYSIQALVYEPDTWWFQAMQLFSYALWLLFVIDLLTRFVICPIKKHFFRRNWLDTITCAIPQLRALRALRAFSKDGPLSESGFISGGAITTAVLSTALVVWVGSLMVLNAERGASAANIKTPGQAFWWAFETITTVGYGDYTPVTALGRAYAVMIMFVGISVVGVISASMAATLVKKGAAPPSSPPAPVQDVLDKLDALTDKVTALEKRLAGTDST